MELNEDQQKAFDYVNVKCNEHTYEKRHELWENNAKINREHYLKENPELDGLVVFVIGAGPSLTRNADKLKMIPKNSRGYIMACDASLPYLFDNDIVPDYCISIDGDGRMWDMINNSKNVDTSKVTLITTISSSPNVVKNWEGPKYFFMNRTNNVELDSKIFAISRLHKANRDIKCGEEIVYDDVEMIFGGIKPDLNPGGNVTASAIQFSLFKIFAKKVVLVGLDFSWRDEEAFYAGRANKDMGYERVESEMPQTHPDIHGAEILTNMSFFNFKNVHEQYATMHKKTLVNATEGGILGVNQDGSLIEDIEFLKLEEAIEKYVLKRE